MRSITFLAIAALLPSPGWAHQTSIRGATKIASLTEDRGRLSAAEVLSWSQEQRDENFQRMEHLFPARKVPAKGRTRPLPIGTSIEAALGGAEAVRQTIDRMNIAGLLVLRNGTVRLEKYARGVLPQERWTSFSVAKSITSILVGAAIKDGFIHSLDDRVTRYVTKLSGSVYEEVSIRNLLTMTSGVRWNEDYNDPNSDVVRLFALEPTPEESAVISYLKQLPRNSAPGTKWAYNTGESNLVGVLVAEATGKPLAQYLSEKLWQPYGMETDAYWEVDQLGQEIAGCCLAMVLRDYGRVGQFMLEAGENGQGGVLPEGWIAESTATHQQVSDSIGYGYLWWTNANGSYAAIGVYGQMIYVDPSRDLVIVTLSAWPKPTGDELSASRAALIEAVSRAVDTESGRSTGRQLPPN